MKTFSDEVEAKKFVLAQFEYNVWLDENNAYGLAECDSCHDEKPLATWEMVNEDGSEELSFMCLECALLNWKYLKKLD